MAVEDKRVFRVRVRGRGSTLNNELGVLRPPTRGEALALRIIGASTDLSRQTPRTTFGKYAVASLGLFFVGGT